MSFNFILNQSILKKISVSSFCSIMRLSKKSLIVQLRHFPYCSHCSHCSHNRLCNSHSHNRPHIPSSKPSLALARTLTIAPTYPAPSIRWLWLAPHQFKIHNSKFIIKHYFISLPHNFKTLQNVGN